MKKFNLIILIAGLIFATSCKDELELKPYDALQADQILTTAQGFEDAVKGMYSGFRADGYYGEYSGALISPDILSDNLTFNPQGRTTHKDLFEFRNTAVDESIGIYFRGYRIASRANSIIDNIENLPESEFRDNIQGEALAIRALTHFDMARYYCKIPTQSADANTSLGIYYAESYQPSEKVRRVGTTVANVYQNVIRDLEAAVNLIGDDNGVGRLNSAAVHGILARVQLHNGNYAEVIENADAVIASSYVVAPRAMFGEIWFDEYEDNVLFKIKVVDQDNVRPGVPYSQEAPSGIRSEFVCSYELFNLFAASDIRGATSVVTSSFDGDLYNHVAKYLGRRSGDKTVIDGKYLRIEEVILSKAEAHYRLGQEAEALAALDLVREERYTGFVSGGETGQALLDAILLERRLELAFEGDRFFTLKRLGLDLVRGNNGEFADGSGTPPVVLTYAAGGDRWQLPIPQSAFDSNVDLTQEDQNPGY
jgi:hypothetical protein